MIQQLYIENYTLIEHLSIDFEEGFSVITGETGAGKSILIDALALLLGQRADTSVLFDKNRKSIIEATFDIRDQNLSSLFEEEDLDYDDICIIHREINPQSKSRAFINDTPVHINTLKRIGEKLVDIHSQHSNLLLQDNNFQLLVLDQYARLDKEIKTYKDTFRIFQAQKKQLQELFDKSGNQDKEYLEFLSKELEEAKLTAGEQNELEERLQMLSHAEEIKQKLSEIINMVDFNEINVFQLLQDCKQRLSSMEKHSLKLETLSNRFNSILIDLKDITNEIATIAENTAYDPHEIEQLSARLNTLYRLEQKHKVNNEQDLIAVKEQLREKLQAIYQVEISTSDLKESILQIEKQLYLLAKDLSQKRNNIIPSIEQALKEKLQAMNMPQAMIKIVLEQSNQLTETGLDKPVFLFNANRGTDMKAMAKVASGGELSRLMLAIKSLILQKNILPTIIFDEIDSGVSGEVSAKMGKVMQEIARFIQVIAITHLPQIASKAKAHYLVYKKDDKEKTCSQIKRLSQEERVVEIAKMISNEKLSDSTLQAAQSLLNNE
ncbi:MAG: DNA repair protein RecN [Bacteroidales bacterium]|jgi:DNA repair protein RecN (Recombination protein N)|nr:DNA repair protein RecN [Bacteroidales bacterium]